MEEMGNALQILSTEVLSQVGQTVLQATFLGALMGAIQWPLCVYKFCLCHRNSADPHVLISVNQTRLSHRQSLVQCPGSCKGSRPCTRGRPHPTGYRCSPYYSHRLLFGSSDDILLLTGTCETESIRHRSGRLPFGCYFYCLSTNVAASPQCRCGAVRQLLRPKRLGFGIPIPCHCWWFGHCDRFATG